MSPRSIAPTLIAAALLFAADLAWADDAEAGDPESEPATAVANPMPGGAARAAAWAESLTTPRYTRSEPGLPSAALLPVSGAVAGSRTDLIELSRRWWLSHRDAAIGMGFGTVAHAVTTPETRPDETPGLRNAVPSLSVGMRYRVSPEHAIYADAANARGLYGKGSEAYFTKVGVEWQGAPSSGWGFARGGIGLRLDSGKTMTMRIKGGGLGVYLRSKF